MLDSGTGDVRKEVQRESECYLYIIEGQDEYRS